MTRRNLMVFSAAATALGSLMSGSRPARAAGEKVEAAEQLVQATAQLRKDIVENLHHQREGHKGDDEIYAVMAAGAIDGQARAFRDLLEERDRDTQIRLAWDEMRRSLDVNGRRILHAHVPREVRRDWNQVQEAAQVVERKIRNRPRF